MLRDVGKTNPSSAEALNERHDHAQLPHHLPPFVGEQALGILHRGMVGQRVCDLCAYPLVQHIPYKSYAAQIYYTTTFADYCFPFAGLSPSLSRTMFEIVVVVVVVVAVVVAVVVVVVVVVASS